VINGCACGWLSSTVDDGLPNGREITQLNSLNWGAGCDPNATTPRELISGLQFLCHHSSLSPWGKTVGRGRLKQTEPSAWSWRARTQSLLLEDELLLQHIKLVCSQSPHQRNPGPFATRSVTLFDLRGAAMPVPVVLADTSRRLPFHTKIRLYSETIRRPGPTSILPRLVCKMPMTTILTSCSPRSFCRAAFWASRRPECITNKSSLSGRSARGIHHGPAPRRLAEDCHGASSALASPDASRHTDLPLLSGLQWINFLERATLAWKPAGQGALRALRVASFYIVSATGLKLLASPRRP